ncbi:MAG: hypothetical protein ACR2PK_09490 [Acidimicrobiales bacterium]
MSDLSPEMIRERLVELDDELRALPSDAFARKHELNTESDELRRQLAEQLGDDIDDANAGWAERAGHKGTHSVNEGEQIAQAGIASPIDN